MAVREFVLQRREFLSKLGFLAGAAAAVPTGLSLLTRVDSALPPEALPAIDAIARGPAPLGVSLAAAAAAPTGPGVVSDLDIRALFGPVVAGTQIGRWHIDAIHPAHLGAIPVVLRDRDGTRFQVDVLRREGGLIATLGVANTRSLSLFLANQGNGSTRTDEEHGLGAMALGMVLQRREELGAPAPRLHTLRERHAAFPRGVYSVIGTERASALV